MNIDQAFNILRDIGLIEVKVDNNEGRLSYDDQLLLHFKMTYQNIINLAQIIEASQDPDFQELLTKYKSLKAFK